MNLKHEYGQYFTESELCDFIVNETIKYIDNPKLFLEPSYGDGNFITSIQKIVPNSVIDAFEIDSEIFKPINGSSCVNGDFLFTEIEKKYDVIIGNPPYIELPYSFYEEKQKKAFRKKFHKKGRGRTNLAHAFLDKAFELVVDSGVISYLLPSTILSSPWYNDIRETIFNEFSIMNVIEDVKFKGVSQQVCLLIIKKKKTEKKEFITKTDGGYVIGEKIKQTVGKSLKQSGFQVGVGKYCWSHHKNLLNNEENGVKLLYSSYISDRTIVEIDNRNPLKKKYLDIPNPEILPHAIVFPRTISKTLKMAFVTNNQYVFENHVVYITTEKKKDLVKLYRYLQKNSQLILSLLNSTTLTKFEIENLIVDFN